MPCTAHLVCSKACWGPRLRGQYPPTGAACQHKPPSAPDTGGPRLNEGGQPSSPRAPTAWSFLSQLKAKKPLQVITWLCDQIRRYYISVFTAPEAGARSRARPGEELRFAGSQHQNVVGPTQLRLSLQRRPSVSRPSVVPYTQTGGVTRARPQAAGLAQPLASTVHAHTI